MLRQTLGALVLWFLLPTLSEAAVDCPDLFQRDGIDGKAYVLAFVGGPEALPSNKQQRDSMRIQLQSRVSPRMQQYLDGLAEKVAAQAPFEVLLIACDFAMDTGTFTHEDAKKLWERNVIGMLWASQEAGKPAVVHLSVPYFNRMNTPNTRPAEIVWAHSSSSALRMEDWMAELDRDSVAQQALLTMGIGFVSLKQAALPLAMLSFCRARSNLKLMAQETLRPSAKSLEDRLGALLATAIGEVDEQAMRRKFSAENVRALKLACN